MSFDSRFFQAAEDELNRRRLRNENILKRNEREIEKNQPGIYKIHREICLTSAKLISLILGDEPDFERKLCELETENELLQKRLAESLVKSGYPADFLEMPCICKKCGDRGTVGSRRCECFMEIVKKAAANEINSSSPMSLSEFDNFNLSYYDDKQITHIGCPAREIMTDNFEYCKAYAKDFHLPYDSILMSGATGLGKTHLSLSIANEVLKKGYSVIYGSAPDLFRKCELEHFGKEEGNTIDMLLAVDLLIIDDLGAEFESKFYNSVLYNLVNNRMNASKPTIISTNCDTNELKTRYGDRISSRLYSMEQLIFVGTDIRALLK